MPSDVVEARALHVGSLTSSAYRMIFSTSEVYKVATNVRSAQRNRFSASIHSIRIYGARPHSRYRSERGWSTRTVCRL